MNNIMISKITPKIFGVLDIKFTLEGGDKGVAQYIPLTSINHPRGTIVKHGPIHPNAGIRSIIKLSHL
jgi:hypothetical protein